MGFEALLGNGQLKENLAVSFQNNRISHGYLLSGPKGAGKQTLARLLAAAAVCREGNRPCMQCVHCRKALGGNHPDVITVNDPEKKTVSVDLIRQARADIYIQPNEADKKVYIFPRAQDMRVEAQNALLKVLEEPPAYGMFLLLTDAPEKLLPTIRSRCVELKLRSLPEEILKPALQKEFPQAESQDIEAAMARSGGFLGQAKQLLADGQLVAPQTQQFAEGYASRDGLALLKVLTGMEKWKREELLEILNQWKSVLVGSLSCRAGMPTENPLSRRISGQRSAADIHKAVNALQKAAEYAQANVSPAAICSWLSWELR